MIASRRDKPFTLPLLLLVACALAACDGGEVPLGGVIIDEPEDDPTAPPEPGFLSPALEPFGLNQVRMRWLPDAEAQFYHVVRQDHDGTGFNRITPDNGVTGTNYVDVVPVHLTNWPQVAYQLASCNSVGPCVAGQNTYRPGSTATRALNGVVGYGTVADPAYYHQLGWILDLSADGDTLAVGTNLELEAAENTGGRAYIFRRDGFDWVVEARLTPAEPPSSPGAPKDRFGSALALSADGDLLAVGAQQYSNRTGRVHLFQHDDGAWTEQAVLQAPNAAALSQFGNAVALGLSNEGMLLAVGAYLEDSAASGISTSAAAYNCSSSPASCALESGAVYVYTRPMYRAIGDVPAGSGNAPPNAAYWSPVQIPSHDPASLYAADTLVLQAGVIYRAVNEVPAGSDSAPPNTTYWETAGLPTYDPESTYSDDTVVHGRNWILKSYIKAANARAGSYFGQTVALSTDGATLAVGATLEDSGPLRMHDPTLTYTESELVRGVGTVYVAISDVPPGPASAPPNASYWESAGLFTYNPASSYAIGTLVHLSRVVYRAIDAVSPGVANAPPNTAFWAPAALGAHDPASPYEAGALVQDSATVYRAITAVPATAVNAPPNATYWSASAIPVYDAAAIHAAGALVQRNGNLYRALGEVPAGIANAPPEESHWEPADDNCDDCNINSGTTYVFARGDAGAWTQSALLKADNADTGDEFGAALAMSDDGDTLLVGAPGERSGKRFLLDFDWNDLASDSPANPSSPQNDNRSAGAGAAYLFRREAGTWAQAAYLKAHNTVVLNNNADGDRFGHSVALSGNGAVAAIGAPLESSAATGIDTAQFTGTSTANSNDFGAVYVYALEDERFFYLKETRDAGNIDHSGDGRYGHGLSLSRDGFTLAVGTPGDDCGNPNLAGVHNTIPANNTITTAPCDSVVNSENSGSFQLY